MTRLHEPRRHADGAPDIDYYRRRARRIRHLARRQAWDAMRRFIAALCRSLVPSGRRAHATPAGLRATRVLAVLACAVVAPAQAEGPQAGGFTATALHVAPLHASPWWIFRMYRIDLRSGAETAPSMPLGDEFVLVAEGSIVIEIEGEAPRLLRAGQAFQYRPLTPQITRNASASAPATLIVSSVSGVGLPAGMPLAGMD